MAELLADENFPLPAVRHLRSLGHDVLTAAETGMINRRIPDDIVLEYATRLGRAVITLNWQDFVELHDADPSHAGIVVCEVDGDAAALAICVDGALAAYDALAGALLEVAYT